MQRLDLFGLEATTIDWDVYREDAQAPLRARDLKQLRPHQQNALDDVMNGFEVHDRGKLIMACGTGKTLTALRIAERVAGAGGRVLFAAPLVSLVGQALRDWTHDAELPIRAFAVCSSESAALPMLPVAEAPTSTRPEVAMVAGKSRSASEAPFAPNRFCQNSGLAGLGSPHPRNGEGTLLACPDCTSTATTKRKGRTVLGLRRFRCRACRRRFNERTGPPFNDRQDPTDIVLLAVRWRLRDTLGFRDIAALLLQRGFEGSHEPIRAWKFRFAPLRADRLRAKRRGHAGRSWYLDETDENIAGRWCSR